MADAEVKTFKSLGLCQQLVEACENLKWKEPTPIQAKAIPPALQGLTCYLVILIIILQINYNFLPCLLTVMFFANF